MHAYDFVERPSGFEGCFLLIRIRLCIFGKNAKKIVSHDVCSYKNLSVWFRSVLQSSKPPTCSCEEVSIVINELDHDLTGLEESAFSRSPLMKQPFNSLRMNVSRVKVICCSVTYEVFTACFYGMIPHWGTPFLCSRDRRKILCGLKTSEDNT